MGTRTQSSVKQDAPGVKAVELPHRCPRCGAAIVAEAGDKEAFIYCPGCAAEYEDTVTMTTALGRQLGLYSPQLPLGV